MRNQHRSAYAFQSIHQVVDAYHASPEGPLGTLRRDKLQGNLATTDPT